MTKPKLNLLSMEELSRIIRNSGIDEHLRKLALDELHFREEKFQRAFTRYGNFQRINYATV